MTGHYTIVRVRGGGSAVRASDCDGTLHYCASQRGEKRCPRLRLQQQLLPPQLGQVPQHRAHGRPRARVGVPAPEKNRDVLGEKLVGIKTPPSASPIKEKRRGGLTGR